MLRKRGRQRDSDISRRQRESTALAQLHTLLSTANEEKEREEHKQGGDADTPKRWKVDILEQSVRRIEQLQLLVTQLAQLCNQQLPCDSQPQPRRNITPSAASSDCHLDLLPRFVSSHLDSRLRRESLHASMFVQSSVCLALFEVSSGLITDVSDRFLQHTGWERSHLVGRRWMPPLHALTSTSQPQFTAVQHDRRVLVEGAGGRLEESRPEPQCERSLQLLGELYRGQCDSIDVVWRGRLRDGRCYDKRVHHWVSEWDERNVDAGDCSKQQRQRLPTFVMSLLNSRETILIE